MANRRALLWRAMARAASRRRVGDKGSTEPPPSDVMSTQALAEKCASVKLLDDDLWGLQYAHWDENCTEPAVEQNAVSPNRRGAPWKRR